MGMDIEHAAAAKEKEEEEVLDVSARALRDHLEDLLQEFGDTRSQINLMNQNTGVEEAVEQASREMEERFVMLVSQYSTESLERAVHMKLNIAESSPRYTGRLPLNLACDKNSPIQVIQYLLESDTDKSSVLHKDKWGDLPIHTACSRRGYSDVIKLLLEYDENKQTLLQKDIHGYLPLHTACRYQASPEVIQLLLDSDDSQTSLYQQENYGQVPLHVACRCNAPPQTLQMLVDYDKKKASLLEEDTAGRIPLHVALLRIRNLKSIEILLKAMIAGRMERVGLELWKRDILRFIRKMAIHERDFTTRDKLDMIVDTFKQMLEKLYVLELVLWKATCARYSENQEVKELNESFKRDCRIKSGACEIIKGVFPFIEEDCLAKLLDDFANY
mmetsp:Transcript_26243/g.39726  ORF Transcript_26243/g.39726 Transcript_26243/m.39726 type:complete len:388 (-) Transcript_26243:2348-3511(-)